MACLKCCILLSVAMFHFSSAASLTVRRRDESLPEPTKELVAKIQSALDVARQGVDGDDLEDLMEVIVEEAGRILDNAGVQVAPEDVDAILTEIRPNVMKALEGEDLNGAKSKLDYNLLVLEKLADKLVKDPSQLHATVVAIEQTAQEVIDSVQAIEKIFTDFFHTLGVTKRQSATFGGSYNPNSKTHGLNLGYKKGRLGLGATAKFGPYGNSYGVSGSYKFKNGGVLTGGYERGPFGSNTFKIGYTLNFGK